MAPASLYERALARHGEAQEAREKLLESLKELRQTADSFLAVAESTATVFAALATARPPVPVPMAADGAGRKDAAESAPAPPPPPTPVGDQVAPFIVPEAPAVSRAVTSPNNATGRPGVPLRVTVTTTGDPVPSISFKGDPPPRITLTDHGDGTATVTGTPKKEGVHRLVIRAKFGSGPDKYVVSQSFTLTVFDS